MRKVLCCVSCLRQQRARSGHVEGEVASGHRAEMGMPGAQAKEHARAHGPGAQPVQPDAARLKGGGSREQAAYRGARPFGRNVFLEAHFASRNCGPD